MARQNGQPGSPYAADDDHFYGEDRAMAEEMKCGSCGWPFAEAAPECGHEVADD